MANKNNCMNMNLYKSIHNVDRVIYHSVKANDVEIID